MQNETPQDESIDGGGGDQTAEAGDSLYSDFFRLSFFNVLSNVTVPLAGLVDTAMLGRLPDIRFLAGVALATILFDYIYWSFGFLRMATTGTTAIALGRRDEQEAFEILYRSGTIALSIGALILVFQAPLREIGFALLTGSEGVESAGRDYFSARIWAAPFTLANFVLLGWFLGRAEGGRALVMTIAANVTNIVGDYILILRMGFDARGAGWATAAGQVVMFVVGLALLPRLHAWNWRRILDRDALLATFRMNRDILIRTVLLLSAFALFMNASTVLGTVVLAAHTLLIRLLSFAAYLIDGFAFALEGIAGRLWGAGNRRGTQRILHIAIGCGFVCAAATSAVLTVAPEAIFSLLTTHTPTLQAAVQYAPYLVAVLLLATPAYIYDGLFLGLAEVKTLRNAMILSFVVGLVPLVWLGYRSSDARWLWFGMITFMLLRNATLGWSARRILAAR